MTTTIKLPGGVTLTRTSGGTTWSGTQPQITEGKAKTKRFKRVFGQEPSYSEEDLKRLQTINKSEFDVKQLFDDGWSETNIKTIITHPTLFPVLEQIQLDLLARSGISESLLSSWAVGSE